MLFQKFAGIDVFDIEVDETDPDKLVDIIASLEPTFGGINLEDIKAPECFVVERKLRERMKIPVFHDDQHGTAIIVGAAVLNAMAITGKKIEDVKLATTGMGAAGISCVNMLVQLGLKPENILAFDREGVIHTGRTDLDPEKQRYARDTGKHPGRDRRRRGHLPGAVGTGHPDRRDGQDHGPGSGDLRAGQPDSGNHAGSGAPPVRTRSSAPAARTTRTRSTTCCASRTCSVVRWTWARLRSTRK